MKPRRLSVSATLDAAYGTADVAAVLDELMDSVVPACCEDGCEVEPDGTCEHGHPAVTLALGVI